MGKSAVKAVLLLGVSTVVTGGCCMGNKTVAHDELRVGDELHAVDVYYDEHHRVVKRETFVNGKLVDTWTPQTK